MQIHLLRNKHREIKITTACGTDPYISNKQVRNARTTYQQIPSDYVVNFETFRTTEPRKRCAHCVEAGLIIRNRQRAAKGLAPVSNLFD